jgi:hypothetical protein
MTYEPHHYERVARAMDGETVDLTETERQLMADLQADEQQLASALQATPSPAAMQRARRRLHAAVAKNTSPWTRPIGLAGAVAAGILLLLGLQLYWPSAETYPQPAPSPTAEIRNDPLVTAFQQVVPLETDQLASSQPAGDLQLTEADPLGDDLNALQEQIDAFWQEETFTTLNEVQS